MNKKMIAGSILLMIVMMSVVFFSMTSIDAESSTWQYDDYRIVADVTDVSGVLELKTVGETEYVHAKDVGTGYINYSDGKNEKITVERAKLDVWLMTGQSNAAYFFRELTKDETVDPSKADPIPIPGTAYYYGTDATYDCLETGNPTFMSMTNNEGGAAIGDKAPSFAATYHERTGHKIYWICGAISGTYIHEFDPVDGGPVWTYMEKVIPQALDAVDDTKFILVPQGYMWIQGEFNADTPIEEYKFHFNRMHSAILAGGLGIKFSHCFVSQVASGNSKPALVQISKENPTVTISVDIAKYFTLENGLLGDEAHYTQIGDNRIGVLLGESCASWVNHQPEQNPSESPEHITSAIIVVLVIVVASAFIVILKKKNN